MLKKRDFIRIDGNFKQKQLSESTMSLKFQQKIFNLRFKRKSYSYMVTNNVLAETA